LDFSNKSKVSGEYAFTSRIINGKKKGCMLCSALPANGLIKTIVIITSEN
jgi:hypothetical protein